MQPAQTGRVRGDGAELKYAWWSGAGSPVIALHGLTASHMNFVGIAERLGARRGVFALDLRGRGDSEKAGPFGMAQHARDAACAMRAMGFGKSVIAGHSMGAFVATALAEQDPELVSALVLIDGGYGPAIGGADPRRSLDAMVSTRVEQLRKTYPSREFYRNFWRHQPHFPAADWNAWVEAFLDYELGGEPPALRPKASIEAVKADLAEAFEAGDIERRLRSIRVPAILLRAERGFIPQQAPLFPDTIVPAVRALIPQLEDEWIGGTTHYTIALGEKGAGRIAERIAALA